MPKLLMNDRAVAGLSANRQTTYFDMKTRGLALRVGARTKTWYFVYRNGGDPEWLKLGAYPAVGLSEARTVALDRRHGLDIKDIDPAVERRKEPVEQEPTAAAFTFADFVRSTSPSRRGARKSGRTKRRRSRGICSRRGARSRSRAIAQPHCGPLHQEPARARAGSQSQEAPLTSIGA